MRLSPLVFALVVGCLPGCHPHVAVQTPSEFLALEGARRQGHDFRAITPDGVAMQAKVVKNEGHGSLAFWAQAVENRLRRGGYAILAKSDVRAKSGEAGRQIRCGLEEQGRPYDYWITLFVSEDWIYVVEAGGRRDRFEPLTAEIERAITSFSAH